MKTTNSVFTIALLFLYSLALGQEHSSSKDHGRHHGKHKLAFTIGYTHIPDAFEQGNNDDDIFVATLGVDYAYQFSHRFAVAGILDTELDEYSITESSSDIDVLRRNVFILAAVIQFYITPSLLIYAGPGIELESDKNYALGKFGIEWEFIEGDNWGIGPFVTYDIKEEYDSWEIGMSFSRRFGK